MLNIEDRLKEYLVEIAAGWGIGDLDLEVGTPRSREYGDLSTNIALKLSKPLKKSPKDIAASILPKLKEDFKDVFDNIEIVEPGFINFYFSTEYLYGFLGDILKDERVFLNNIGKGKKVLIEFVSANPTGPLSIAHGRQAAIGAALARILSSSGYRVDREYYVNDEGNQINLLGESLRVRCLELLGKESELPGEGYQGEYLIDVAEKIVKDEKLSIEEIENRELNYFSEYALEWILSGIKGSLSDFGVDFEGWVSQRDIAAKSSMEDVITKLKSKGHIYEQNKALWFKSSDFGDSQDRVVIKHDGSYTYFIADIAYHLDKYKRDYDLLIDIWGPDHHGYIKRVEAALDALGYEARRLKVLIVQLATLYRDGKPIKLSTRRNETITLDEVLSEIGSDATLFFLLNRKLDSHLDFDLEFAKKKTMDNPVYYIQYAHARISSIISFAQQNNIDLREPLSSDITASLRESEEKDILRSLVQFSRIIKIAALTMEPSFIAAYLYELAQQFHGFYNKHRVVTDSAALTKARLYVCSAIQIVLKKGLGLLGISAPDSM
ncbi:MAG: arginine--tRNA ligase [Candidatus Kaelpia aquatica]|nr:arginine--tRNA ligase [Candidatus Kaelpia aquatica]